MKYLLINPNNRLNSPFAGLEPPLWLGLIASDLKVKGNEVEVMDAEVMDLSLSMVIEFVRNINPDKIIIVVMGGNPSVSSTPKMPITKRIIESLNGYQNKISVTGLHPSALPKETEAELKVPVLQGKIFDGLPFIDWDMFDLRNYKAHNWHCLDGSLRSPYASIYTSLGCPFKCSFCNIHALYGSHTVWYREADHVASDIDLLFNKYGVRNIKIWDECFTLNSNHVREVCEQLAKRKYDLNMWAYARVNTVNLDLLNLMRDSGIKWLCYGFESGSNEILKKVNKNAIKEQARIAVNLSHEAGINVLGNFIYGLPGDTEETMNETLDFAKSLGIEYVNFYTAKKYAGSQIYDGDKDWAGFNQYKESITEAEKFTDKAFIEFFSDPQYLTRISKKFGSQAVRHIADMLEFGKPVAKGA